MKLILAGVGQVTQSLPALSGAHGSKGRVLVNKMGFDKLSLT